MSTVTKLINNRFGGIRRKTGSFSDELISCSDCQNVELFFTKLNSGIGIRTVKGNRNVSTHEVDGEVESLIPDGEEIIGIFESNQDTITYMFVYTESLTAGHLYNVNLTGKTITEFTVSGFTFAKTGYACGTDFTQGWLDMFVFSNGTNMMYIYSNTDTHERLQIEDAENIHLVDGEGNNVSGLGLAVFDSRLWVFNERTLWYSEQLNCRNFTPGGTITKTSPGYISFVKNITAIAPYLGSLAVFHKNSSSLVQVDQSTTDMPSFINSDESPGGCASYKALVFHGTDLYFYDDTKKGVFSFQQVVNGDKTLGDNIAVDLQEELNQISNSNLNKIRALSVVTKDRNEVWFLIPTNETYIIDDVTKPASIVLIFDYIRQEWVKRKCQKINEIAIVNGVLFSANTDIYEEYYGNTFSGDYIESYYNCSIFNLGEDNTMKITKFPPRITVDGEYVCNFWVRYIRNYNTAKKPKEKNIKSKQQADTAKYNEGGKYNSGLIYKKRTLNAIVKMPSVTFKALEIDFYTQEENKSFAIKAIEFSKLKVKQV